MSFIDAINMVMESEAEPADERSSPGFFKRRILSLLGKFKKESEHKNNRLLVALLFNCRQNYKPFVGDFKQCYVYSTKFYLASSRRNVMNFVMYGKIVDTLEEVVLKKESEK